MAACEAYCAGKNDGLEFIVVKEIAMLLADNEALHHFT